jgi:hypothetical protein
MNERDEYVSKLIERLRGIAISFNTLAQQLNSLSLTLEESFPPIPGE